MRRPTKARLPDPPSGANWYSCLVDISNSGGSANAYFDPHFDQDTAGAFFEFLLAAPDETIALSRVKESFLAEGLYVNSVEKLVQILSADDLTPGLASALLQWDEVPNIVRGQMFAYGTGNPQ